LVARWLLGYGDGGKGVVVVGAWREVWLEKFHENVGGDWNNILFVCDTL